MKFVLWHRFSTSRYKFEMLMINERHNEAAASDDTIEQALPQPVEGFDNDREDYLNVDEIKKEVTPTTGDGERRFEGTVETRDIIEGVSFGAIGEGDNE
jgi:hypothetical protein